MRYITQIIQIFHLAENKFLHEIDLGTFLNPFWNRWRGAAPDLERWDNRRHLFGIILATVLTRFWHRFRHHYFVHLAARAFISQTPDPKQTNVFKEKPVFHAKKNIACFPYSGVFEINARGNHFDNHFDRSLTSVLSSSLTSFWHRGRRRRPPAPAYST